MIERYREWCEHERDCNAKMLAMIASVPKENMDTPKFKKAVQLAHHLAACRENWLDRMDTGGTHQTDWWPENEKEDTLRHRYDMIEARWGHYLSTLSDKDLAKDFEFPASDGKRYRWSIEGQIVQLVGHAFYHRGQISLLVDELGGETVDTDYLYWAVSRNPRFGEIKE